VCLVSVLSLGLTACGLVGGMTRQPAGPPTPIASADLTGVAPGSVVTAMSAPAVETIVNSGRVARITYRSTDANTGQPTVVSGIVAVPADTPPADGWPVVAMGHGTTGMQQPCAPSLSPNLSDLAPLVAQIVEAGFAVTVADYQGLGAPGVHPYLDSHTAGYNVIDSVRALRATFPGVSSRWSGFGLSQGGGAVWSADEQSADYAPELDLVGAVAMAPTADVSGAVDKAMDNRLTEEQTVPFLWILASLAQIHPDFNLDDYRRGFAAQNWGALLACDGSGTAAKRTSLARKIPPSDISPSSAQVAARLRGLIEGWAVPQRMLNAPLSVVYGTSDKFVDYQWTERAIDRACDLGGTVLVTAESGKGHADLDTLSQLEWLRGRFAGESVENGCPTRKPR